MFDIFKGYDPAWLNCSEKMMTKQKLLLTNIFRKYKLSIHISIPGIIYEIVGHYFMYEIYPSIRASVQLKSTNIIINSFENVNRDDYWPNISKYINSIGTVIKHHPTNGVKVLFSNNPDISFWFEPNVLKQFTGKIIKMKRYLMDDKVLNKQKNHEYIDKVGTIVKHFKNDGNLSIKYGKDIISDVNPNNIESVTDYFDITLSNEISNIISNNNIPNLNEFGKRTVVKITEHFELIQYYFNLVNRGDCYEWMRNCCGQVGYVELTHPTNGVFVVLIHQRIRVWLEPGCLEMIFQRNINNNIDGLKERLYVNTKVEYLDNNSKYYKRVGRIQLHFPNNNRYDMISVRFDDNSCMEILPEKVRIVDRFYDTF